jgi:signal transduction histidine kinase/ActR/RegA family two-component response regulator
MSEETKDSDLIDAAFQRWFHELSDRGFFTTDCDLVVKTWNHWLEAQTGIAADQAVGQLLVDLVPSLVDRGLDRYYHDAIAGEVKVLSERFHKYLIPISRNFHAVGVTDMAQSARIAPLLVDGVVVGTLTVIEDVTERVVSERELRSQIAASEHARGVAEEASRLKDEFLATLSHEIRTPLNAVLGWARILRTQPNVKSRTHALEVIERNAASQLRLVEDLLDMARVISGKLRLDVKLVDIREVATAAIDVVRPAAEAKQIAIDTTVDDTLPAVSGDAERLQQVVWNLMSNAVKFTERDGHITVHVRHIGDSVALSVRDTGQGIARDFLPYVFDRFRQADASASRRHGGLGLGLALVRQIVELHGGTVSVDSAGTNKGTTFEIRLPATTALAATRKGGAKGRDRRESVTLKGVSILIVDDNDDGREMLMAALSDYGARIVAVDSASKALDVLSNDEFVPNIVIADVGMPEIDGYGLIRQIRESLTPRVSQVPAIAVTAYANPEDRIRALVAGFQAHVAKPVDAPLLAASIRTLASRRRSLSVRK